MKKYAAGGIDPARNGGAALCTLRHEDKKPKLELHAPIYGVNHMWFARMCQFMDQIWMWQAKPDVQMRIWIEQGGHAFRKNSLKGDSRGITTWQGMGRFQGFTLAAWYRAGAGKSFRVGNPKIVKLIDTGVWTRQWGHHRIASKKIGKGMNRVNEASALVDGASDALKSLKKDPRLVDVAESILIAGGLCLAMRSATNAGKKSLTI